MNTITKLLTALAMCFAVTPSAWAIATGYYKIVSVADESYALMGKENYTVYCQSNGVYDSDKMGQCDLDRDGSDVVISRNSGHIMQVEDAGGGFYRIRDIHTSRYFNVNGGTAKDSQNVQLWNNDNTDAVKWKIVDAGDGACELITKCGNNDGFALDVPGGNCEEGKSVKLWTVNHSVAQKWKFIPVDDNGTRMDKYIAPDDAGRFYRTVAYGPDKDKPMMELTNPDYADPVNGMTFTITHFVHPEFSVDVSGGNMANDTKIHIWTSNNTNINQQFVLRYRGNGYYSIHAAKDEKYCLDGASEYQEHVSDDHVNEDGFNVHLWEYVGVDAQLWRFERQSDGSFYIICKRSERTLDVQWSELNYDKWPNYNDGYQIQTWTKNNNRDEKWKLRPVFNGAVFEGKAVTDPYFANYLVSKYGYIYNMVTHKIVRHATEKSFMHRGEYPTCENNTYNDNGGDGIRNHTECIVIMPEYYDTDRNFTDLGEYGDSTATQMLGASNFKGIEYFPHLKTLELSRHIQGDNQKKYTQGYTHITHNGLNLQYNTELETLDLNYAKFSSMDQIRASHIHELVNLKYLKLCNNQLPEFDLRPYTKLQRFEASHNWNLTKIEASPNNNLKELAIFDTMYGWDDSYGLQKLIDNYKNLVFLHAFSTMTYELDLSQHTELQSLWLHKSEWGANEEAIKDGGLYKIVAARNPNYGLDVSNGEQKDGANIQLWDMYPDGEPNGNSTFRFAKDGDYYELKFANNENFNINGNGYTPSAGANVTLWTRGNSDNDNSRWKFNKNTDGSYQITNKKSPGLALDIDNAVFDNGTNVKLWNASGHIAQKWSLVAQDIPVTGRLMAKGNWLHTLDLSNNKKLRDVHVQNMHLSSLNITSPFIGQALAADNTTDLNYPTWHVCREVSGVTGYMPRRGADNYDKAVSPHYIEVSNNYRNIDADVAMWTSNGTKYWMYYLRLDYNGSSTDPEAYNQIGLKEKTNYEIFSYDSNYLNDTGQGGEKGRGSRKKVVIDTPLSEDGFNAGKVTGAYLATEVDNLNTKGVRNHTKGAGLCMITEENGSVTILNESAVPAEFLNGVNKNVKGTIIILKAGVGNQSDVIDLPASICYDYECMATAPAGAPGRLGISPMAVNSVPGTFYFNINYPTFIINNNTIVTGIEDVKVENTAKQVIDVKYYNVAGQESVLPFHGINIMKVTYDDGTTSTTKVIK